MLAGIDRGSHFYSKLAQSAVPSVRSGVMMLTDLVKGKESLPDCLRNGLKGGGEGW